MLTWNREPLTEQQVTEVTQALAHLHCGNGYLTSAQDPLLSAFCAAFSVSVVHAFVRSTFVYEVKAPRRAVRLYTVHYYSTYSTFYPIPYRTLHYALYPTSQSRTQAD